MDTSQYLSMFLEESMDNLQALNESLLQLEQEPNDIDKLNEIFRIAHTIKGMAATMGYNVMAELTHKMEDVLEEFRNGKLKVTQNVVTVLFQCLDTLETMVNNISEGEDDKVSIEEILKNLEEITKNDDVEEDLITNKNDVNGDKKILKVQLNEYDINIVKQAAYKGFKSFEIIINLSKNTLLKSARAFLIFKSLEENGEIIKSLPNVEDIESENFDFQIALVYITNKDKEEIYKSLMNISEVESVYIELITPLNLKNDIKEENTKIDNNNLVFTNENFINAKEVQKETAVHKKSHQSVRVDLERLDKFMNMVSELVIHRTRLEQISSNLKITELNETLEQVARTTSDLQDLVMKIRMILSWGCI